MNWRIFMPTLLVLTGLSFGAAADDIKVGVERNMNATIIAPAGAGPYPGVLVLHTSGGLQQPDIVFAQRLAQEGYVAMIPAFMAAYGITEETRVQTFTTKADAVYADLVAAIETLRADRRMAGGRIGAVGFSNGGFFTAWLAATDKIAAGVSYYGAYDGARSDPELARFQALITNTSAPLLVLHGSADQTVRIPTARAFIGMLRNAGARFDARIYDGAPHNFERGRNAASEAAADSWRRTVVYFAQNLR